MKNKIHISVLILAGCFSFIGLAAQINTSYPEDIENVLLKAGNNRSQLERFLTHYKDNENTLKWEAACFLVRNMDIHYSEVYHWVDSLNRKVIFDELDYANFSQSINAFNKLNTRSKLRAVINTQFDIHYIKADFLIDNLEKAFDVWKMPRSKHLDFNEFCEYILPYRNVTEQLESWRGNFIKKFSPQNKNSQYTNLHQSTNLLSNRVSSYFVGSYSYEAKMSPVSFLSPSQLLFRKRGHCEDLVNLTLMAFKSQGIPCRIDMVPYHGTSTGRHFWNTVIGEEHQIIPFEVSEKFVNDFTMKREPSKVITITYGKQPDALASFINEKDIPNNYLRNRNYKDVTDLYWPTKDIKCELFQNYDQKVAYIAVLNGLSWRPAFWGKIEAGNKVTFTKMGCGVAYLPMIYEAGKLKSAGYPVLLFHSKEIKVLKPDLKNTHTITLKEEEKYLKYRQRKNYKLFYWNNKWVLTGSKKASSSQVLHFDNIPKNALLLLIPEYSQKKERPFYITDEGKRLWW